MGTGALAEDRVADCLAEDRQRCSDRGTRCWRPPFVRSPGIVHSFAVRLISPHVMLNTSPARAAVSTVNLSDLGE